jgi:hypothetical protein
MCPSPRQRNKETFVANLCRKVSTSWHIDGITNGATSCRCLQRSRLPSHCQSAKPPQHNLCPYHLIYRDSHSPVVFISSTVVPAGIEHLHTAEHNLIGNARLHAAEVLPKRQLHGTRPLRMKQLHSRLAKPNAYSGLWPSFQMSLLLSGASLPSPAVRGGR